MDTLENDSVFELLQKSIDGDRAATERLCDRLRPRLLRWASGRLPRWARNGIDTDDLVQEAMMRTLAEPGDSPPGFSKSPPSSRTGAGSRRREMDLPRFTGPSPMADQCSMSVGGASGDSGLGAGTVRLDPVGTSP